MIGTGDNWYNYGIGFGFDPGWPFLPRKVGLEATEAGKPLTTTSPSRQVNPRCNSASSSLPMVLSTGMTDLLSITSRSLIRFPDDIGVINIAAPFSAPDLSAAESITVEIENFGTLSQTGFPVSYQIDGGTIVTETFTGTLDPGAVADYTFAATAISATTAITRWCAWTSLAGMMIPPMTTSARPSPTCCPLPRDDAYYIYSDVYGGSEPGTRLPTLKPWMMYL